ncbi:unnamed protein product [Prunus armeniaca]
MRPLHLVLHEEVYVDQPPGFVIKNREDGVYRLKKALYGLKQAPRAWYEEINSYFEKAGFKTSLSEATLYVKFTESGILIVSLYVDDIIYTGSSRELLLDFKTEMMKQYEMTDLGLLHHFMGLGVIQTETYIFLHQKKYAKTLLDMFGFKDCKSIATPLAVNEKLSKQDGSEQADESLYRQVVGSLLYLTATRPDIMFVASLLARFMHGPTRKHMGTTKRVLRYIQGTLDYGIAYERGKEAVLIGYCDSDWSGSEDDMKSTSGYAFHLGSGVFSWASVKQSSVALFTAEAEYVSAAEATAQAMWLRFVLSDFGEEQISSTSILCDNTTTIAITKNPVHHHKTRHINRRFHFIRDALQNGDIDLLYCKIEEHTIDIFTKALARDRVFAVALQKAGSPSNLDFKSDGVDSKITGSLKPVDVLMLPWMCWAISWNSRTSKISKEKTDLPPPDINQIVSSAIVSCPEVGSGLNVWDCQLSGLEVELPVGKFLSWILRTVPSLPDWFSQFVYAILKNCVSHKDSLRHNGKCPRKPECNGF